MRQTLGEGILNWAAEERRSDRYGFVFLLDRPPKTLMDDSPEVLPLFKQSNGAVGTLYAIVKENRKSHHVGDLFHHVYPRVPKVGQEIRLGAGTLRYAGANGRTSVGVQPDDGRATLWMNIQALYDAHEQTVILQFEPAAN